MLWVGDTIFLVHGLSQNKGLLQPAATCCNPDLPQGFQLPSPLVQVLLSIQAVLLLWASFALLHPELHRPLFGLHVRVWSGLQIGHPCTHNIFSEFSYPDLPTFPPSVDFIFLLPLTVGITSHAFLTLLRAFSFLSTPPFSLWGTHPNPAYPLCSPELQGICLPAQYLHGGIAKLSQTHHI